MDTMESDKSMHNAPLDTEGHAQPHMVAGLIPHWHRHLDEIDAASWDRMAEHAGSSPFLRHAFFKAMQDSGSACPDTGWHPRFLTLRDASGHIQAGCPLYAKDHSYGEYVFDWAWADAHDRALASQGLRYFPKLLSAVPFSPIPGQRLLVQPELDGVASRAARMLLLSTLQSACKAEGLSSAHLLFLSPEEAQVAEQSGWLLRHGVQFHWQNRTEAPYADFEEFLASLHRDKRKKILQERRKVRDAGVVFHTRVGAHISEGDWDFFYRCYAQTYREHGQQPYLSRGFWHQVAQALPECWTMFVAHQHGEPIAASLLAVDPQQKVAYGRYWGALAQVSCLHFEACYYQSLQWCIEQGMQRFEGGAQGEHKLARGLLPVSTGSAHHLRHPGLRQAVSDFLAREDRGIEHYIHELDDRKPFKPPSPRP